VIQLFFHSIAGRAVQISQKSADSVLRGVQVLVNGTLTGTSSGLDLLSNAFFYKPEWRDALQHAGVTIRDTNQKANENLRSTIELTNTNFEKAFFAVDSLGKKGDQLIFDNRVISSILGSSHNQKFKLTKIDMSFRTLGADVTAKEVAEEFRASNKTKLILFIPGLFTDETVWLEKWIPYKRKKIRSLGISTEFQKKEYFPVYVRYNHGLPIHENGKKLMHLLDIFFQECPEAKPNLIAYSLGGLVLRSCLYYAKEEKKLWVNQFQKVISIATPNRGSYLEKIGFWLGLILEKSPNIALKIIGMVGNLRSDAIKDLSFGLVKEEPKTLWSPISQYFQDTYHGELDDIDAYEAYAVIDTIENPIQNFLGDGIVEKQSLRYLSDRVYGKKENPSLRTLEVMKATHFSILNSRKLFIWLNQIL